MIKNKRKIIAILGIFSLFIGVSSLPSVSSINVTISQYVKISKTVIRVDDDGDGDYTSIQDAIDHAINGDIIEVYSGTYDDIITVDKQLNLIGIDSELGGGGGTGKPLLNGECGGDEEVIHVKVDGCSISGFHIDSPDKCLYGILVESDDNDIFQNDVENTNFGICCDQSSYNRVYDNFVRGTFYAIIISNSYNSQIYTNNVDDNGYGIYICNYAENNIVYNNIASNIDAVGIYTCYSSNNTIYKNMIISCDKGIVLGVDEDDNGNGMTVYGNSIKSCDTGIMVTGAFHNIYKNNITNCRYGLLMEKIETFPPVHCCANKVYENNIIDSRETGIWLKDVYTSEIYWNNITGSEDEGLLLDSSELNDIFENNITQNKKTGLYCIGSENNIIYHNNFIGNHENAYSWGSPPKDRRNKWNLPLTKNGGGNYWDDYNGKDRNGDNVGDLPYIIPDHDFNPFNNDVDKYPLMEPNGRPNVKIKSINKQIYSNKLFLRLIERFPILLKVFLCLIPR
ncbi:hypothetical protein AYK24_03975 [Thermoplasmatales archaeon SG8-52-4]|nr:MAG: hypothetical protein AYK24_03975 [Thermoplasmatales archaeon SG8-52-4]